jgi:hypothetical protein
LRGTPNVNRGHGNVTIVDRGGPALSRMTGQEEPALPAICSAVGNNTHRRLHEMDAIGMDSGGDPQWSGFTVTVHLIHCRNRLRPQIINLVHCHRKSAPSYALNLNQPLSDRVPNNLRDRLEM